MAIEELKRIFRMPVIKKEKEGYPRREKRPWRKDSGQREDGADKKTRKIDIKA